MFQDNPSPARLVRQECKFRRLERMNHKSFLDPRSLVQRVKEFRSPRVDNATREFSSAFERPDYCGRTLCPVDSLVRLLQADRFQELRQGHAIESAKGGELHDIDAPLARFALGDIRRVGSQPLGHIQLRQSCVVARLSQRLNHPPILSRVLRFLHCRAARKCLRQRRPGGYNFPTWEIVERIAIQAERRPERCSNDPNEHPCRLARQECKFARLERTNLESFPDPRWLAQRVKEFRPFDALAAALMTHSPAARGGRGLQNEERCEHLEF